ncbi:MAG: tetratricopeptide repeat protein [Proteobacteria bacterium]|nr:tetratricopeptide repeat protein [Pseudomonadota bacterium]
MGKISSVVSLIGMTNFRGLALSTVLLGLGACATGPPAPIIDGTKSVDVAPSIPISTAVPTPAVPSADPGPIVTAIENDVQFRAEHLVEKLDEPRERVADPSVDATKTMLASVDADIAAENFGAAAGSIERAIQISPSDSWAWHKLAKLRFAQGQHAEAKAIARRSNSLSDAGGDVQIANLRLIARIERLSGNATAAKQAQAQADKIAAEKN